MIKWFTASSVFILALSCSDGKSRKSDPVPPRTDEASKKDDKPKVASGSDSKTATPQLCAVQDQVFDEASSSCRKPTEKECYELNRAWWNDSCHAPTPNSDTTLKNILDLAQHCERTAQGAYFNCKDFVITDPVKSTYEVKDSDPEWMKNGEWDISATMQFSCSSYGKVLLQPTGVAAPMDTFPSEDFIFRKISASNPAQIKVQFSEDAVVNSNCSLILTQKYTTPSNFQLIADDYAQGKVDGAWIIDQFRKIQGSATLTVPFVYSGLLYEWYTNIRDKLKGELVYDVQRDCPADKKSNSTKVWTVCNVPITKDVHHVDDSLKNKPLISICNSNFTRSPLSITMNGSTYLLPVESKTPTTDFSVSSKVSALTNFCFVKILN